MNYLKDFLKLKRISQKKLSEDLNVSHSYISAIVNGKQKIGKKIALRLNELYGADIEKLMFNDLINIKTVYVNHEVQNMAIVPIKAYGGFLNGYENEVFIDQLEHIAFPMIKGKCFAFEVDGYSMIPEFNPGDYFVGTKIESTNDLVKDRCYVFQTEDGLILKKFSHIDENNFCHIYSNNKDYNPVNPIHLENIKIIYHKEATIKF